MAASGELRAKKRPREETGEDEDARTAYVEGMPYETTEDDLRAFFSGEGAEGAGAGGADNVVAIRMPKYQDTGRCMGYAHVVFGTADAMEASLAKDGAYLGSRFLNVSRANARSSGASGGALPSRGRPAGCSTLFVKNMPYSADEEAVQRAFSKFGKVASVRVPRWGNTQNSKGFAYVQFLKGEAASAAVAAAAEEPMRMEGRALSMDYDTGAPKASFRGSDGRAWAKTEGKDLRRKGIAAPAPRRDGASGEGAERAPRRKRRSKRGGDE